MEISALEELVMRAQIKAANIEIKIKYERVYRERISQLFRRGRNSKTIPKNVSLRRWKEGPCIVPSRETSLGSILG